MRRGLAALLLAALLASALAGCGSSGTAPYAAEDLRSGEAVSVDDLRGSPALLVSWTTWCAECDELLSGLQAFADSPPADGVRIVAVNLDSAGVADEIDAKLAQHGVATELWRDRRNEFKAAFGALGVPTTVLLDADGNVAGTFPGAADFDGEVAEAIATLDDR